MKDRFHDAFEPIHATEHLKQNTAAFIHHTVAKKQRRPLVSWRHALACCAMLTLVLCAVGGYQLYVTPVSFISVDVDPSVELALNRSDRVVDVTAYGADGAQLLQTLPLNNKPYTQAVELLLSDERVQHYLSEDAFLSFTVVSDKEEVLLAGLQQCQGYAQANAVCHSADAQLLADAHHSGLSVGRYRAFLELVQYDETMTAQDCQDMSMRQIWDLLRRYQTEAGAPANGGQGAVHHGGAGDSRGHGRGHSDGGGRDAPAE